MTRLTNFVILSYCILDESKDVLSAKGILLSYHDIFITFKTHCNKQGFLNTFEID